MKNIIWAALILLFFSACKGKNTPPSGVLQKEQMSAVMWDMFQAQAWAQQAAFKDSLLSVPKETRDLSDKVLQLHHLSQKDFQKSYQWYLKHPDVFKVLLDSLYAQKSRVNYPTLKKEGLHPIKHLSPLEEDK